MDYKLMADVVFLIEGTASNGAFLDEIKTLYIQAILDMFDHKMSITQFAIVVFKSSSNPPEKTTITYGPCTSSKKIMRLIASLNFLEKSEAHITEGFAATHACFEDMKRNRSQLVFGTLFRHCILICTSMPYEAPALESFEFRDCNLDEMMYLIHRRGIHLSLISGRILPEFYKIFLRSAGDQLFIARNYAQSTQHLALIKGFTLFDLTESDNCATAIKKTLNREPKSTQRVKLSKSKKTKMTFGFF